MSKNKSATVVKSKSKSKSDKSKAQGAPATVEIEKKVKTQTWRDYNANRELTQSHFINRFLHERNDKGATVAQLTSDVVDVCDESSKNYSEAAFKLFSATGRLFDGRAPRVDRIKARVYQHVKYMLTDRKTIELRDGAYYLNAATLKAIEANAALLAPVVAKSEAPAKKGRKSK